VIKIAYFSLFLGLIALPIMGQTNAAKASLHGLSLRFQPATYKLFSLTYTLELTTSSADAPTANGELAPVWDPNLPNHGCLYRLYDPSFPEPMVNVIYFDVPPVTDDNHNGFHDFFEVSQAVNATTTGIFDYFPDSQGAVKTTWTRAAHSRVGTCKLQLVDLGLTFTHTFELLEYDGFLNYTSTSTQATGTLRLLAQPADDTNLIAGAALLIKTNADTVYLTEGSWTNAAGQSLTFQANDPFTRDGTNYLGFVDLQDGDPNTETADYRTWILLIGDPNDTNHNGVPDLSDATVAPKAPSLTLSRVGNQLQLGIHGEIGTAYAIEQAGTIPTTNWTLLQSLTLSNAIQTLNIPLPAETARFWRAKVP
jgi:hypothetical protein